MRLLRHSGDGYMPLQLRRSASSPQHTAPQVLPCSCSGFPPCCMLPSASPWVRARVQLRIMRGVGGCVVADCRRYAVIGGGLAGVATAWHLLRLGTQASPVQLDLFDPAGEAT